MGSSSERPGKEFKVGSRDDNDNAEASQTESVKHLAEEAIRDIRAELEERVRQRTTILSATVDELKIELARRRESEQRYRSLIENASDAVFTVAVDGTITYANPQSEKLFGADLSAIIGQHVTAFGHPDDNPQVVDHLHRRLRGEAVENCCSTRLKRASGEIRSCEINVSVVKEFDHIVGTLVFARDVTKYIQLLESLRASEERYRAAAHGSLDSFYLLDCVRDDHGNVVDFLFCDVNERGARMVKMTPEQVIGQQLCQLFPINRTDGFFDKYLHVFESGHVLEEEFEIHASIFDGWLHHQVVPMENGVAIISRDITEKRQSEQAMRHADRLAALGTLSAEIAHEINNPLSAAWAAAEMAKTVSYKSGAEDTLDECLDVLGDMVQRCQDITSNILRFARRKPSVKKNHDLNEIVRLALKTTAFYTNAHGSVIDANLAGHLPQVTVNAQEIEQVLINLIRNAVQAGATSITVTSEYDRQAVHVRVRDNGHGIPEADFDQIFDPFFTSSDDADGTGLGLSVSYRIIADHQGTIEVQSQVGVGTTFTVTLPLSPSDKLRGPHSRPASTSNNASW